MSSNRSVSRSATDINSFQAKNFTKQLLPSFDKAKFDPDKDPNGFRAWAKKIQDISIAHFQDPARILFNFIDLKTGRRTQHHMNTKLNTIPAILLQEGLHQGSPSPSCFFPNNGSEVHQHQRPRGADLGASTGTNVSSAASEAPPEDEEVMINIPRGRAPAEDIPSDIDANEEYLDATTFPEEVKALNNYLYVTVTNIYIGSNGTIIDLPGDYATFTNVMIMLWDQDKKNIAARKIQAVDAFTQLQYQGDPSIWRSSVLSCISEIYATQYNLNDMIYQILINQLKNGDPETLIILTKQLNELNSQADPSEAQNWEANLAPVINYLLTSKAVMGGGAPVQALTSSPTKRDNSKGPQGPPPGFPPWSTDPPDPTCKGVICGNCKQPDHHRRKNCPFTHLDKGPLCDYCGVKGHKSEDCRLRKKDLEKPAPTNSVTDATERAELLSQLASIDARTKGNATCYVREVHDGEPPKTPSELGDSTSIDNIRCICSHRGHVSEMCRPAKKQVSPQQANPNDSEGGSESISPEELQRVQEMIDRLQATPFRPPPEEIIMNNHSTKSQDSAYSTDEEREVEVDRNDEQENLNDIDGQEPRDSIQDPEQHHQRNVSEFLYSIIEGFVTRAAKPGSSHSEHAKFVNLINDFSGGTSATLEPHDNRHTFLQDLKDMCSLSRPAPGPDERQEGMVNAPLPKQEVAKQDRQKGVILTKPEGLPDPRGPVPDMMLTSDSPEETSAGIEEGSVGTALENEAKPRSKANAPPSAPIYSVAPSTVDQGAQNIVISLCDGMGCAAMALQEAGVPVSRYLAVELDAKQRLIASFANPKTDNFPGIDHTWENDINNITEKHIAAFPRNSIKAIVGGTECSDFSKKRLLPSTEAFKAARLKQARDSGGKYLPNSVPRQGLNGKKGSTFRTAIQIWRWVKKYNPDVIFLFENVEFKDMADDWAEVNSALGEPLIINSHDYSTTARNRAWWHNGQALREDPKKGMGDAGPIDPNSCMDGDRVVDTYIANGQTKVRPLGATWGGDPQNPESQSNRKTWVHDPNHPGHPQELHVTEAEKLHGLKPGSTAAPDATPLDRMRAIGGGWDLHIAVPLMKALFGTNHQPINYASPLVSEKARGLPEKLTPDHYDTLKSLRNPKVRENLSRDSLAFYVALRHHPDALAYEGAVNPADGAESSPVNMVLRGSIIDSGASKHVCKAIEIEDATRSTRLCGFEGTHVWTEGRGYMPIQTTTQTGNTVQLDIGDVDQYSRTETNLFSMGKLIQDGWTIHCSKSDTYGILPDGERVPLYFNEENVLCLKHDLRSGRAAARIPGSAATFAAFSEDARPGAHQTNWGSHQGKPLTCSNAYAALQPSTQYYDSKYWIDDGQEY